MKAKPELNGMIGNCIAFDKSWGPKKLRKMKKKRFIYIFWMIRFKFVVYLEEVFRIVFNCGLFGTSFWYGKGI